MTKRVPRKLAVLLFSSNREAVDVDVIVCDNYVKQVVGI